MTNKLFADNEKSSSTMASRKRRTQSFGGFLSNDITGDCQSSGMPFQLLMPPSEFSTGSSNHATDSGCLRSCTSPVRTSSVDDTLMENAADSASSVGGVTSASYIRLFPYLNRSSSIENQQQQQQSGGNLRRSGGQSCPSVDVRCDIVEYL